MLRPTSVSARNLALAQVLISATHVAKTADSVLYTFGLAIVGLRLLITTIDIQTLILLCSTMTMRELFQTMMAKELELSNQLIQAIKQTAFISYANDQGAEKQLEHFVPNRSSGLTPRGLGRINRSIEAFGYCILVAQANTRSSLIGSTGTAINTQTDFLVLVDDAIRNLTASSEPVKYQTAIELTKVRLNFAVARGVLLLPSRMIINTESVIGYNNNLRRTTDDMKLGVNNQVNLPTKKAALKLMAGVQVRSIHQTATPQTLSTNRPCKPRG